MKEPLPTVSLGRDLLENLPVAAYICDSTGVILRHNAPALEIWGREPAGDEMDVRFLNTLKARRPDGKLIPPALTPVARVLREQAPQREALALERPDGSRLVVDVFASPLRCEGEAGGVVVVMVPAERSAVPATDERLEQCIAERTAELRYAQRQLRSLASELTLAEQRERRRVAHRLQDHLAQLLAAGKMKVGSLKAALPGGTLRSGLEEVSDLLDQALQSSRKLTLELSPPVLFELGFTAAVAWLSEQMFKHHGVRVSAKADPQAEPEAEEMRIFMFQILRELLLNVAKHAQADRAKVQVRREGQAIRMVVEDQGVGFEPAAQIYDPNRPSGVGLFNVRQRVDLLNGEFHVESAPGKGTRVTVVIPTTEAAWRWAVKAPPEDVREAS